MTGQSSRSRSVSRSRVIKKSDLFLSGEVLDPYALLEGIVENLKSVDIPLAVVIKDETNTVTYLLSVFLNKEYEIREGKVIFGFKKLDVAHLRVSLEYNLSLVDN